jgi:hypothetical protein
MIKEKRYSDILDLFEVTKPYIMNKNKTKNSHVQMKLLTIVTKCHFLTVNYSYIACLLIYFEVYAVKKNTKESMEKTEKLIREFSPENFSLISAAHIVMLAINHVSIFI